MYDDVNRVHQEKRDHGKVCSFFLAIFVSLVKHVPIEVLCRNRLFKLFEGALPFSRLQYIDVDVKPIPMSL